MSTSYVTPYIHSNVSAEEFFKCHCTEANAVAFYEQVAAEQAKMAKELESANRAVEILEEQVDFAHLLIEELEAKMGRAKSLEDFRKAWKTSLDNSSFEL